MKTPVYLDYAATAPVDPRVAKVMCECLTLEGKFGNPASRSHIYGWQAEEAVENARSSVAELIGADSREIVWTSGATEAINLALKGAAFANEDKGRHIITAKTEHKAVLDTCEFLQSQGFDITYLTPPEDGIIRAAQVVDALREDTCLVSVMHVNNEIGVINDIANIGAVCRERGVLFHVDAAQSAGKTQVDVGELKVDLLSVSAHKMYGPKGIGALYVRRHPDVKIAAQIHGGGHERGMRSGTLPTHQIVGFGEAAQIAKNELAEEELRIKTLRTRLLDGLADIPEMVVHGSLEQRVAGNLNLGFGFVEGETLLMSLRNLAISTGSACTSVTVEPSYVLQAIGVERELAHSSLRISLGRFTTSEEVDFAIEAITSTIEKLRAVSPAWQQHKTQQSARAEC